MKSGEQGQLRSANLTFVFSLLTAAKKVSSTRVQHPLKQDDTDTSK